MLSFSPLYLLRWMFYKLFVLFHYIVAVILHSVFYKSSVSLTINCTFLYSLSVHFYEHVCIVMKINWMVEIISWYMYIRYFIYFLYFLSSQQLLYEIFIFSFDFLVSVLTKINFPMINFIRFLFSFAIEWKSAYNIYWLYSEFSI